MPAVSTELNEAREGIKAKRKELKDIFDAAGPDRDLSKVESLKNLPDTTARIEFVSNLNSEIEDLVAKAAPLEAEHATLTKAEHQIAEGEKLAAHPGHIDPEQKGTGTAPGVKDLVRFGDQSFKTLGEGVAAMKLGENKGKEMELDISAERVKTLFETGAGWEPETIRTGRVVDYPLSQLGLLDVIPMTTTNQAAVVYMRESTFSDNAAAETAEAGQFPEAALELTEESSTVRKIPVFLPVTDEQLEDVPQVSGYINNRLPQMIRRRLARQIISGDGISPNLEGITEASGVQTQPVGADDIQDAAHKGMTLVNKTGDSQCSAFVANSATWESIYLQRTADGLYIWGHPSVAGPRTLWGLPSVVDETLADDAMLTGDFRTYCELAVKRGITLKVSDSHSDFFIKGKQAIRADMRAAFVNYRPAAFVLVSD